MDRESRNGVSSEAEVPTAVLDTRDDPGDDAVLVSEIAADRTNQSWFMALPVPLRIAVGLFTATAFCTFVGFVCGEQTLAKASISIGFVVLAILGIHQRASGVRVLALVVLYLSAVLLAVGAVLALPELGRRSFAVAIPLAYIGTLVWGLQCRASTQYFRED